jgi:plastocyanin
MKNFTLLFLFFLSAVFTASSQHNVSVQNFSFTPANLTINAGETVTWTNNQGFHNVNGTQATFPNNPAGFGNGTANAPWTYSFTFNTPGTYQYRCDVHPAQMQGTITVEGVNPPDPALLLTGVFDGPLTGGVPKGFELYALDDIADLSAYGVGSANNGQGSGGQEYTFPAVSLSAGDFIYVTNDSAAFVAFFGFSPDLNDGGLASNVNGDDAVELFYNSEVIDVFGDINVDGTGQPWEYLDGWAYRVSGTGPDGNTFALSHWYFSGIDIFDNTTTNGQAALPFPLGTYSLTAPEFVIAADDNAMGQVNEALTINALANDLLPGTLVSFAIVDAPANGTASINSANNTISYIPEQDFCGEDSFTYRVCNQTSCDTATVNVMIECEATYPAYDIATVRTVNADGVADSLNVVCQIQGIVYGVDQRGGAGVQFTVIDNTGGIGVFSNTLDTYTVTEGDEIIVRGTIGQFNGLTQILADEIAHISSGNALQAADVVTALGENTESNLVRINNLTLVDPGQWSNSGAGFTVDVTDGTNTYSLRIDNDVDIYGTPAPNSPFNLTGIGGQFDNTAPFTEGYQILPRYIADIDLITGVEENILAGKITASPNPSNGLFTIESEVDLDEVVITSYTGQTILRIAQPGLRKQLDLSDVAPGVYHLTFRSGADQYMSKIVVR